MLEKGNRSNEFDFIYGFSRRCLLSIKYNFSVCVEANASVCVRCICGTIRKVEKGLVLISENDICQADKRTQGESVSKEKFSIRFDTCGTYELIFDIKSAHSSAHTNIAHITHTHTLTYEYAVTV